MIGLLPTYNQIGVLAPLLLLLLRLIQGFSVGGEIPGSNSIYCRAYAPSSAWIFCGSSIYVRHLGNVLAGIVGFLLTIWLNGGQMLQWGWRVPLE